MFDLFEVDPSNNRHPHKIRIDDLFGEFIPNALSKLDSMIEGVPASWEVQTQSAIDGEVTRFRHELNNDLNIQNELANLQRQEQTVSAQQPEKMSTQIQDDEQKQMELAALAELARIQGPR